jgi:hypothetical protein
MSVSKGKGWAYAALVATSFFWGTTWVASKWAVQSIPSIQLAAIRQCLAGCFFVGYFLFYKKHPLPTLLQWRWLLVMSVIMFVFANWMSTWGIQYITTGLGALIGSLYPLSVVLIEFIFFKSKKINGLTIIGLLLGILGVSVVFYNSMLTQMNEKVLLGICLSVFAMLSWSLGTVFLTRNKVNINPYYATGWQMLISAFILLSIGLYRHQFSSVVQMPMSVWGAILYLVVFGSIVSFIAFIYSTKHLPPAIASLYAYINPIVAIVVASWVFKNEALTSAVLWGTLITIGGVYLVNASMKKAAAQNPMVEPEI